jgi:hypothetical protein
MRSNNTRGFSRDLVLLSFGLMVMIFGLILAFLMVVYSRIQLPQTIGIPIYEQHSEKTAQTVRESTSTRLDNSRVRQQDPESSGVVN